MAADKKSRAILDPEAVRELWGRAQRILNEIDQITATTGVTPGLSEELLAAVIDASSAAWTLSTKMQNLYKEVVKACEDPELVLPPKKDPMGFKGSEEAPDA